MLDLKVKQFPGKKVGWVVTILVFTKTTGSGWFSIAQNGCNNSFKSSKTTTSSIQYVVFFGMFNLQKCWNNSSAIWKKKTIRQEATLRIEEEHGNLKGYDSTTTKLPVELTPLVFRKWPKGNKNSTRIKMNLDNHVSRWTFCLFPWYVCPFFFRDTLVITCNYHLNISKRFLPGIVDGNTRPTSPSFFHSNELAQLVLTLE